MDIMTIVQARLQTRLACLGVALEDRPRYLSQRSGLALGRAESLLNGTVPASRVGTRDLEMLATGLDVPAWWLALPFTGQAQCPSQ